MERWILRGLTAALRLEGRWVKEGGCSAKIEDVRYSMKLEGNNTDYILS